MPKDKIEAVEEPKKKMVVVEEIVEPEAEETTKPEVIETTEVPEVTVKEIQPEVSEINVEEEVEKTNYLWIIIPTALLIGALVGGLITYFSGLSNLDKSDVAATSTPVATANPSETATPSAEPKSEVVRTGFKIQILNGSGVSGLAGKAKTYLEGLGYDSVVTGNASVSNFTETEISYKESSKTLLETITADLAKNYKVAAETKVLPTTSKYDFVITLGSK